MESSVDIVIGLILLGVALFATVMLYVIISDRIDYDQKAGVLTPEQARQQTQRLNRPIYAPTRH